MSGFLLTWCALLSHGGEPPSAPGAEWGVEAAAPAPVVPRGRKGRFKGADDRKAHRNYRTGDLIAGTGLILGTAGLVTLGAGALGNPKTRELPLGRPDPLALHTSAGLLAVGGLVGSSGALGAAVAVDNATKKSSPVIASALGLTLGIFSPTFFGVGLGLQNTGFAIAAISTGAVATCLTAVQLVQTSNHVPKRWMAYADPVSRRLHLAWTF